MKNILNISEALFLSINFLVKLFLRKYVKNNSFISLSYSSTESWETILESIALQNSDLPVYDGDGIHQPPLVLSFWKMVMRLFKKYEFLSFCIIDTFCIYATLKLSTEIISIFVKNQEKFNTKDKSLLIEMKSLRKLRLMLCLWHVFNPLLNISILSQSITCLNNLLFLILFFNIVKENYYFAAWICSFMAYSSLYPFFFLLVLLIGAKKNGSCLAVLGIFFSNLLFLLTISYCMVGYRFVPNVYWHHFYLNDSNPQMNLYWYMMATMFDHFRSFFKCTFQIILASLCFGLSAKYKDDLVFLTYMLQWTINVLKPYPSIGEIGQLIALAPFYQHLFRYLRFGIVTSIMIFCVIILGPLMHYLWLVNGTANANFYFAITLVYCGGQSHLVSSFLSAYLKYLFYLNHGKDVKLSDGSEVRLRAK